MKTTFTLFLILSTPFLFLHQLTAQQWPIAPQDQQQYQIVGTVGEERGGRQRWHKGVDVAAPDSTPVRAIESGHFFKLRDDGNEVCVGRYCYTHIDPVMLPPNTFVDAGTIIGYIQPGAAHVHLQLSEEAFSIDNLPPISVFNNDDEVWLNALDALAPFIDNAAPDIDAVSLWRHGVNNQSIPGPLLFGAVDLLVNVEDPRVGANGGGAGGGCAPYSMTWEVVNSEDEVLANFDGINFENAPPNTNASPSIVFGVGSQWQAPNFEYFITNDPFETPHNKYWHLLQSDDENASYDDLATCPSQALLKDGNDLNITVRACDIADNCDHRTLSNNGQAINFTIDNFKPFIQSVRMIVGGKVIYESRWNCSTCGGIVYEAEPTALYDKEALMQNGMRVHVELSEAINLHDITLHIPFFNVSGLGGNVLNGIGHSVSFDTGPISSFNTAASKALHFEAEDFNGNELINLAAVTNSECVSIPTRATATTWDNDVLPQGEDKTHLLPCSAIALNNIQVAIKEPSACGSADGSLRIFGGNQPEGGFAPYVYSWYDQLGNKVGEGPVANNLSDGNYNCVATDATGCTGQIGFSLVAEDTPELAKEIQAACIGQENGWLDVWIAPTSNVGETYDFEWSNGTVHKNVRSSRIEQLPSDNYCVTIKANVGDCELTKCYEVEEIRPEDIEIEAIVKHACADGNSGEINIDLQGFGPFERLWQDGSSLLDRSNLSSGTYCLTVTDYCSNTATECFTITTLGENLSLEAVSACRDNGKVLLNTNGVGGNLPFTYLWSNGQSGQNLLGQNSGNYCVTITDAKGCTIERCTDLLTKDYTLIQDIPCIGFNDGRFILEIDNPENEEVTVVFQGNIPINISDEGNTVNAEISGLAAGVPYTIDITIGDCSYSELIEMEGKETETIFDRLEEEVCYYDEFCDGVLIAEDGIQESIRYDYTQGVSTPTKCYIPGFCREREEAKLKFAKKTVKAFAYQQILNNAGSFFPSYVIANLQTMFDNRNVTPCTNIRYCPADLQITFVGVRQKFNGILPTDPPCIKLDCEFSNPTICLEDIMPPYLEGPFGDPVNCESRKYNVYQLIVWHSAMQVAFPNYNAQESSLFGFITNVMNDEELLRRAGCADVTFCKNDFSVLWSNIGELEDYCDLPFTCERNDQEVNPDFIVFDCSRKCTLENGNTALCPNDVIIYTTFVGPGGFFNGPAGGGEEVVQIIPSGNVNTRFSKFGFVIDNGVRVPKGLFRSEAGYKIHDFSIYGERLGLEDIPEMNFFIEDWDTEQQLYVETKTSNAHYSIHYEDLTELWESEIMADNGLEITHFSKNAESVFVGGTFQGALRINSENILQVEDHTVFLLDLSFDGSIKEMHTVESLDAETEHIFYESEGTLFMAGRAAGNSLTINGNHHQITDEDKLLQINLSNGTPKINAPLSWEGNFVLQGIQYVEATSSRHYLFEGSGSLALAGTEILNSDKEEVILLSLNDLDQLLRLNHYEVPEGTTVKAKMTAQDDGNIFVGLNLSGEINLADHAIKSAGGTDILLLHFNPAGNLMGYKQYGSPEEENIAELFLTDETLYFAGTFSGTTKERTIGKHRFLNRANTTENAFLTFLDLNDFQTKDYRAEETTPLTATDQVHVFPNPFNSQIEIQFTASTPALVHIRLYNALGEMLEELIEVEIETPNSIVVLDQLQNLTPGIYFLEIKDDESGKIWSNKIVKN